MRFGAQSQLFHVRSLFLCGVISLAFIALVATPVCGATQLKLSPDKQSGIYDTNDTVGWTVTVPDGIAPPTAACSYTLKKNNQEVVKSGGLDLKSRTAHIEVQVNEPAMIFAEIKVPSENGKDVPPVVAGAAVAPTQLKPVAPRPADFDEFWKKKIALLKTVPANPTITRGTSGVPNVDYATVTMDNFNGTHIYGQFAKPHRVGKFPALVIFQWASPPYPLQKVWVTGPAAEGWLTLNVEPHDVPPDQPQAYYNALPDSLKHYESLGNNDRDRSYFLRMYLGDYRALDYITASSDWDGKTLVVMGISMGGQQSLCVAGLHPKVTHLIVDVPSGCDTNGPLHGRQSSYPNFPSNDPKVMETALYFDAVNFAPHIKAQSLVAMGFVDTISAPAGVWTAFNLIPGPKEVAPMVNSPHNHIATPDEQRPYTERSAEWLAALVKGQPIRPHAETSTAPAKSEK